MSVVRGRLEFAAALAVGLVTLATASSAVATPVGPTSTRVLANANATPDSAAALPGTYHAMPPVRVEDTRDLTPLAPDDELSLPLASLEGPVPADASAVTLSVAVVGPEAGGYLDVTSAAPPGATSTINFAAHVTVSNSVTVKLNSAGEARFYNYSRASLNLVVDLTGYYTGGSVTTPGGFVSMYPARMLDTRNGTGVAKGAVATHHTLTVRVAGRAGVPSSGVGAVVLNVADVSPTGSGYASVYAAGAARPATSSLNFVSGQTIADQVTAAVGADGAVTIYNGSSGSAQFVADIEGYYLSGSATAMGAYRPVTPRRIDLATLGSGTRTVTVDSGTGIPAGNGPVLATLTAHAETASGYVSGYAPATARPETAVLNYGTRAVAEAVTVRESAGKFELYVGTAGRAGLLVDVSGYFVGPAKPVPGTTRSLDGAPVPRPQLVATSCASATFCMAVDNLGRAFAYDGTTWSAPTPMDPAQPTSISCAPPGFCVVGDRAGSVVAYSNGVWSSPRTIVVGYVEAVSCVSASWCLAGSARGQVVHFDGTNWGAPTAIASSSIVSISCPTATFCAAATPWDVMWFDGSDWTAPERPSCASPNPSCDADFEVAALSCTSPTFCVLAGSWVLLTYDGTSWTPHDTTPESGYGSVSCGSADSCVATGSTSFAPVASTYDGTAWTLTYQGLGEVSCAGTSCVAVGGQYAFVRGADGSWSSGSDIDQSSGNLSALACASATFCVAVDDAGNALVYNGASWAAPVLIDPEAGLVAISCVSAQYCVAVDSHGRALSFDGHDWVAHTVVADGTGLAVSCAAAGSCLAVFGDVDGRPVSSSLTGTTWGAPTPDAGDVASLACPTANRCFGVVNGAIVGERSGVWAPSYTPPAPGELASVACASASLCVAVGPGTAATWNGTAWQATALDLDDNGAVVSCPSGGSTCVSSDSQFDGSGWGVPGVGIAQAQVLACPTARFCAGLVGGSSVETVTI